MTEKEYEAKRKYENNWDIFDDNSSETKNEEYGIVKVPKNLIRQLFMLADYSAACQEHFLEHTPQDILIEEDWETKLDAYEFGYMRGRTMQAHETLYMLNSMSFWGKLTHKEREACFELFTWFGPYTQTKVLNNGDYKHDDEQS